MLGNYTQVNSGYGDPFLYSLTKRGFYSEINNLLNVVLYGLVSRRKLIIDQSHFAGGDLVWSDLYKSDLPLLEVDSYKSIHPAWIITGHSSPGFKEIGSSVRRWHRYKRFFFLKPYGFHKNVFAAKRYLARSLCQPLRPAKETYTLSGDYAAIHIRRGDKVNGYISSSGNMIVEGDDCPLGDYLACIRNTSPSVKLIFVMTDQYEVVQSLRSMAPELEIFTLCQNREKGYVQSEFNLLKKQEKVLAIKRMILEVEIASNSQIFFGCYKSNVSRFVTLVHKNPSRCFSVDSQKRWNPM